MSGSILYIHGFNSSPLSTKARQLEAVMQQLGLSAQLRVPILHHHPRHAMLQLEAAIAELGAPLLVGSSLGGYYATHLAERHGLKALLVNPAVTPHKRFDGYLGSQRNHYTGETWELTLDHMQALAELEVPPPEDPNRYQVWLQTADETLTIATPNAITAPVPCVSRPAATTATRASPRKYRHCWRLPVLPGSSTRRSIFLYFDFFAFTRLTTRTHGQSQR